MILNSLEFIVNELQENQFGFEEVNEGKEKNL